LSLFQCEICGCCENTALSGRGCNGEMEKYYDWRGIEDRKGKKLCSACAPTNYSKSELTGLGKWHDKFPRTFLPMGMFKTAQNGNLEHVENGDQDFIKYQIEAADAVSPAPTFEKKGYGNENAA